MSIAIPPFGEGSGLKTISHDRVWVSKDFYTYDGSEYCDSEGNITQGYSSFELKRYKDGAGTYWGELLDSSCNFSNDGGSTWIYTNDPGSGTYHNWAHELKITAPVGSNFNILYLPEDFLKLDLNIYFDFSDVNFGSGNNNIFDSGALSMEFTEMQAYIDGTDTTWHRVNDIGSNSDWRYLSAYSGRLYWPPDYAFIANNISDRSTYSPQEIKIKNYHEVPGRDVQTPSTTTTDHYDNTSKQCSNCSLTTGMNRITRKIGTSSSIWKPLNGFPVDYPSLGNWQFGPYIIFKESVMFRIAAHAHVLSCDFSSGSSSWTANPKATVYGGSFTLKGALHSYKI